MGPSWKDAVFALFLILSAADIAASRLNEKAFGAGFRHEVKSLEMLSLRDDVAMGLVLLQLPCGYGLVDDRAVWLVLSD